jgi:hypothetical protein
MEIDKEKRVDGVKVALPGLRTIPAGLKKINTKKII